MPAAERTETRPYLLERVEDVAVVQLYADGFEALPLDQKILIYHLYQAALARPRHLLRPAIRPQPRDARGARGDPHARPGDRSRHARGHSPLYQALLDQHRPAQQSDGAQVPAEVLVRGVRGGRRNRTNKRGRISAPSGRVARGDARPSPTAVLRRRDRSQSSPTRHQGPDATSCRRARTTSMPV